LRDPKPPSQQGEQQRMVHQGADHRDIPPAVIPLLIVGAWIKA
jgi:hypothetical protein